MTRTAQRVDDTQVSTCCTEDIKRLRDQVYEPIIEVEECSVEVEVSVDFSAILDSSVIIVILFASTPADISDATKQSLVIYIYTVAERSNII